MFAPALPPSTDPATLHFVECFLNPALGKTWLETEGRTEAEVVDDIAGGQIDWAIVTVLACNPRANTCVDATRKIAALVAQRLKSNDAAAATPAAARDLCQRYDLGPAAP